MPFCNWLCHYCGFPKTARFTPELQKRYLSRLADHAKSWLDPVLLKRMGTEELTSVFFGGGTPSLFAKEYEELFAVFSPLLAADNEITIEANPDDITKENLATWKSLGFNRLSIGIQTFSAEGLRYLTRKHTADEGRRAIERAAKLFDNLSVDLIYGYTGQSIDAWETDLKIACDLGVNHLSLYNLTYEPKTPIGRAVVRGKSSAQSDDFLAELYEHGCQILAGKGFDHYEISNFAKHHKSTHNQLYWQNKPYIGIGNGAHGYITDESGIGLRYHYSESERSFVETKLQNLGGPDLIASLSKSGLIPEVARTSRDWLMEYVGCSLRCETGADIALIERVTRRTFAANPIIKEGLDSGTVLLSDGKLLLTEPEWFRETAWSLETVLSFDEIIT